MRHICLDTETTGFDPAKGDRLCELACVELNNYIPTGKTLHKYVNPNRPMPEAAFKVHGLSDTFLRDKPLFIDIADEFLDFIGDAPLVIHNAAFDMKFLNAELRWAKKEAITTNEIIDTLLLARKKYPGAPATLDALCKRFEISLADRTKHGALIDTELLAEVYLNLCDGRAPSFAFDMNSHGINGSKSQEYIVVQRPKKLEPVLTEDEIKAHREFIEKFKEKSLWLQDIS